jgi:hypothetical protein
MTDPFPALYLGPRVPRWQPRTLVDVQAAIDDGTIRESHWLDAKKALNGNAPAKVELARDLASFANDGGLLLVGVSEDKRAGTFSLSPIELAGIAEMVDQVARARCDPPMFVKCHPIADVDDVERGVMVIEIPPSPLAPHMVDCRYHGRSDSTKYNLSDAEVMRLFAVRTARQATTQQLIDAEIARDPILQDKDHETRCYVVATPLASPPDWLTSNLMKNQITELVYESGVVEAGSWWRQIGDNEPRATGRGWHTHGFSYRLPKPAGGSMRKALDVEISDSGSIVVLATGLVLENELRSGTRVKTLWDREAVGLVRSTLSLAGSLGSRFGYAGQWHLAFGLTNLVGTTHSQVINNPFLDDDEFPRYSGERYVEGTVASTGELWNALGSVTQRLAYRLVRALNTAETYATVFADKRE